MNRLIYFIIVLFLSVSPAFVHAQVGTNDPVKENIIERFIETISENSEIEIDFTALTEDLNYYYDNPINLNDAKREDLVQLYLLSEFQIDNLFNYIQKHGQLLSIYEIQLIPGWDNETIYMLLSFVDAQPVKEKQKLSLKNIFKYGKNELVVRYGQILEKQAGYVMNDTNSNEGYLGSPAQVFFRYRFTYKDKVSFGLVGRKDRGEEFFTGSQPFGFDFYGGHIFIQDVGPFKKIALGDFNIQFGQGLTAWTGFGYRKSALAMNVKRFPSGIRPYTASNQAFFNRGVAAEAGFGPVTVTGFFSYKPMDANITSSDSISGEPEEFSSFNESGLHRTVDELENKNKINEIYTGGNVNYKGKKWSVGITGAYTHYNVPLKLSDDPYNQFRFQGQDLVNIGADYNLLLGKFYLFGELSFSGNGSHALLQGVQANLSNNFGLSLLFRDYAPGYQNQNNNAFADRTGSQNERGLYLGFTANPVSKINLMGYIDIFQSPWIRSTIDAPSFGYDFLCQGTYVPNRRTEAYIRVRRTSRMENSTFDDDYTDPIISIEKTNYRFNFTYEVSKELKLKNRVEFVTLEQPDKPFRWGMMVYQDIVYKPTSIPLDLSFRLALFHTDDFDTKIYAYENDVLYSFSVPAYYNKGMRMYLNLKYDITPKLNIWLRLAQTYFSNVDVMGSGLDESIGNTRTDIKLQVRYSFGFYKYKSRK